MPQNDSAIAYFPHTMILSNPADVLALAAALFPIESSQPDETEAMAIAADSNTPTPTPEPDPEPALWRKILEVASKFLLYGGIYLVSRPWVQKMKGAIALYKGVRATSKMLHRFGRQSGRDKWDSKLIAKMQQWKGDGQPNGSMD